ncbi:MAG: DUF4239 domain-containing protein [Actinomycetota bacterium]|nr:DUF4239 domain-containing protein [Actinomycetota bacterium]
MGGLVIVLSVVVALAGLILVRRLVPLEHFKSHNEATSTIHHAIAIVFGVAAAFATVLAWEQLNTAQTITEREAADVETLYRLATQLPESNRNQLQQQTRSYAQIVVEEEWPLLARGQASANAQNAADKLRESVDEFEPQTGGEQELYARLLTKADELEENRGLRLLASQAQVPPLIWAAMVILGIITVAFTYLFGMDTPRLHMVRVAILTVVVALSLYTIHTLEDPFAPGVQVGPEAFESVLERTGG